MVNYTHNGLNLFQYIDNTPCLFTEYRNKSQEARELFDRRCESIEMNNAAGEMALLWQQAKLHPNCVIAARLMTLWNHSVGNFFNLVNDKVHVELDLAVPTTKEDFDQDETWFSFIRLLELSEEFERKYVKHQFAPVSWLSYLGSKTNTNLRWRNPHFLSHTTQSGRCRVYVYNNEILVDFYSPSLEGLSYAQIVFTSHGNLALYAHNEVEWTDNRVDAVVSVLRAFGMDRDDTYKHLNLVTQDRSAEACLKHKTDYQNWLHEQLKDPNFIDYHI
jgi:hypothetical protein